MLETLEYLAADPKVRRAMQEEYWAELNEELWEKQEKEHIQQIATLTNQNSTQFNQITTLFNQITTQSNQISTLTNQVVELQRLLQQSGIEIPSA